MFASESVAGVVGSKIVFEVPVDDMFGQPQPLSTMYHPFTDGRTSSEQRPLSMPDVEMYVGPVIRRSNAKKRKRVSQSSSRSPPYPVHDQEKSTTSTHLGGSIRQPTAEDFIKLEYPLQAPPNDENDPARDLPVIEADSSLHDCLLNETDTHRFEISSESLISTSIRRNSTDSVANPGRVFEQEPSHKRSKSVLDTPSSLKLETTIFEPEVTPARISTIGSDMFSPSLGGLKKIAGAPKKEKTLERVKRLWREMMNGLPFRRH
ncbi:uncharacterized protein K460DRAFT_410663 [Cucurbitaria berberidis CBS 394.84]|uniref:Uncharacterized protein n=1 Tax=Cucurbitaria berberidis CBS 394.84 TaxID=1168544 RepID=A0A9P4G928_9PLEO|nr:uncharacterized protein K460DRAFT_410663 [Cucurbitaria berberidis CBS 394.84]KAF1841275.1 hypothetical protein K460DRAFT_410663 [Cucurbitaria berberidis CBS 394.84]